MTLTNKLRVFLYFVLLLSAVLIACGGSGGSGCSNSPSSNDGGSNNDVIPVRELALIKRVYRLIMSVL